MPVIFPITGQSVYPEIEINALNLPQVAKKIILGVQAHPEKESRLNTTERSSGSTAPVLASQAEAIIDLGRTWPQHRIDIH